MSNSNIDRNKEQIETIVREYKKLQDAVLELHSEYSIEWDIWVDNRVFHLNKALQPFCSRADREAIVSLTFDEDTHWVSFQLSEMR